MPTPGTSADLELFRKSPIRILSLDGGGVRGLSSLLILRQLIQRIEIQRRETVRPCECFDLIIGTGTGGISALFLGRLRMSVDDAIREYLSMAHRAFTPAPTKWPSIIWKQQSGSLLPGTEFSRIIRDIEMRSIGKQDTLVAEPSQHFSQCHSAVLAIPTANVDAPPYVIRSYNTKLPASSLTIPEAARATVSTAGLFSPVSLGRPPVKYGDAGISGYNNPVEIGLQEATLLWPGIKIDCLVSIGTGLQKIVSVGNEWKEIVTASKRIVTSCEIVHDRVFRSLHASDVPYFRFNVDRGLDDITITEWDEVGSDGKLTGITEAYMRWGMVDMSLDSCARMLTKELTTSPDDSVKSSILSGSTVFVSGNTEQGPPHHSVGFLGSTSIPSPTASSALSTRYTDAGDPSTPHTLLRRQRIEITLTLRPNNIPENEVATKVAWQVYSIGDSELPLEFEFPCELGFGSAMKDENGLFRNPFFIRCAHGGSVRVRSRYSNDLWEIGRKEGVEGFVKVVNTTGHTKSVLLGFYHEGMPPRFQPFHLIPEIGNNADYAASTDLVLQVYRTQGLKAGQEIERDRMLEVLFEAQVPFRMVQRGTIWLTLHAGTDGIRFEIKTNY